MKKAPELPRLANAAQLEDFQKQAQPKIAIRHRPDAPLYGGVTNHIMVCCGTGCLSSGAKSVVDAFEKELARHGLDQTVEVVATGCHGFCEMAPLVVVYPQDIFYVRVQSEDAAEIVETTIRGGGRPVERLLYTPHEGARPITRYQDIEFYAKQNRITVRNCGHINP